MPRARPSSLDATGTHIPGAPLLTNAQFDRGGGASAWHDPGLGAVADVSDAWGPPHVQTRPDVGVDEASAFEFTLVRLRPTTTETLLALAQAVAEGAAKAGYYWSVVAVLVAPGDPFPRVQVVYTVTDWTWQGSLGDLGLAIQAAIQARGLADGIGAWQMLALTGSEARTFSPSGGVAPLVVVDGGQARLTKAASTGLSKQLLRGDVRQLAAAVPFSAATTVTTASSATLPPVSAWLLLFGGAAFAWAAWPSLRRMLS